MENFKVAALTLVNQLAQRHGIKPYEFVAVLDDTAVVPTCPDQIELRFESPPGKEKAVAFGRVLNELGISDTGDDMPRLIGSEKSIYSSLEAALQRAPKERPRR